MGAVSLLPLSLQWPQSLLRLRHPSPPSLHPSSSASRRFSSRSRSPWRPSLPPPLRSRNGDFEDESRFMDDERVVEDMDGYLNYLSLDYDSVWDTKPSWCQPWTILLTGVTAIASSWFLLHSAVITTAVLSIICIWWYIFLYAYPKAYSNMIAERRKKVSNGVEDTFGLNKTQ